MLSGVGKFPTGVSNVVQHVQIELPINKEKELCRQGKKTLPLALSITDLGTKLSKIFLGWLQRKRNLQQYKCFSGLALLGYDLEYR